MWNREFEKIYTASSQKGTRSFGSPKQVRQLNINDVRSDLKGGFKIKTETELRESKEAERNKKKEERDKKKFLTSFGGR